MKKKKLILAISLVLVAMVAVGGTLAWLADKSDQVVNTFTAGDINIELTETTTDYEMIPGNTILKDPKVTVKANSEDCWLFVKIDESANLRDYIDYTVATGWTMLSGEAGVYYRQVNASNTDQEFTVIKDNNVSVKTSVSKKMLEGIKEGTIANPTLTFTAYAVQSANITDVSDAWDEAQNSANY